MGDVSVTTTPILCLIKESKWFFNFPKKNTNQEWLTPKLCALNHSAISPYLYYKEMNNSLVL